MVYNYTLVHATLTGKNVAFPVAGYVQEIYRTGDISSTYPGDGNVQEICKMRSRKCDISCMSGNCLERWHVLVQEMCQKYEQNIP